MDSSSTHASTAWPAFAQGDAHATLASLHLLTQMVGKTRLALAPPENHCWNVALYVTTRGLTTSPMPSGRRTVEITLDLVDHELTALTSEGSRAVVPLTARTVAETYSDYRSMLRSLGIETRIYPLPSEIPNAIPFNRDREHSAYDRAVVENYRAILVQVDRVFRYFRAGFLGKCSPVHFWWGAFDLACTRFSGRTAPRHPGGVPGLPDRVARDAYSHECISVGFWPGNPGGPVQEPSFYAYAYPEPEGMRSSPVRPAEAGYHPDLQEWILPYEAVRSSPEPDAGIFEFLQSAYSVAARLGGWDPALERTAVATSRS